MPVLLLDDVFSELDAGRRSCLLSNMGNAQVFITCTDRTFIEKELIDLEKLPSNSTGSKPNISFYEVADGTVRLR